MNRKVSYIISVSLKLRKTVCLGTHSIFLCLHIHEHTIAGKLIICKHPLCTIKTIGMYLHNNLHNYSLVCKNLIP